VEKHSKLIVETVISIKHKRIRRNYTKLRSYARAKCYLLQFAHFTVSFLNPLVRLSSSLIVTASNDKMEPFKGTLDSHNER